MSQRRMLSLKIIDTDAFLDMPTSAQNLYFHLVMRADDEGFVGSPKKIMKLIGSQDDDIKILVAKRFILTFESGVVVIKHWLIHNTIRMDRFCATTYVDEKNQLILKENKAYTEWQPNGNQLETQVNISKDNISKDKLSLAASTAADTKAYNEEINNLMNEFKPINPTINFGNKSNRRALEDLIKQFGVEKTLNTIRYAISIQGQQFAPVITTPWQLKENMGKLLIYNKRESQPKKGGITSL